MARDNNHVNDFADELDAIYRLAQTLTDTPDQAAILTRETYRRANKEINDGYEPEDLNLWLRHLLVEINFREPVGTSIKDLDVDPQEDFRQQAVRNLVRKALPPAFASLPASKRSLLLLCKVDNFSCADAAQVLRMHVDAAASDLSKAVSELRIKIYQIASPPESELLDRHLTDDLLKTSLRQFAASSLRTPPTSLRKAIATDLKPQRRAAGQPQNTKAHSSDESTQQRPTSKWAGHATRAMLVLILIAVAAFIGYAATNYFGTTHETNLLTLSVNEASSVQIQQPVTNTEQAAIYIRDELGTRVAPPTIDGATMRGVNIFEIAPNVRVPVLLYSDGRTDEQIPVYAYTYGQLNRYEDRINLSESVLRRIENERQIVVQEANDQQHALVWRQRDKILVAIPPGDPEELRERIRP